MKRILYVIPTSEYEEAEQKLHHFLTRLDDKNSLEVTAGFLYENPLRAKLRSFEINSPIFGGIAGLAKYLQSNQIDVVYFYSSKRVLQTIAQYASSQTKVVEVVFNRGRKGDSTIVADRSRVDLTIFENQALEKLWPACNSKIVSHGLNPKILESKPIPKSRPVHTRQGIKLVGLINRKNYKLDINTIINLATNFKKNRLPFKLVTYCDDKIKKILEARTQHLDLKNFLAIDSLTNIDIRFLDIYLDLSGSTMTYTLEALYCKVPVLLRESQENISLLEHNRVGFLHKKSDPVELLSKYIISASKINRDQIKIPSKYHIDSTIEQVENIRLNLSAKTKEVLVTDQSTTYYVIPYGIYGGAEVYLENHINQGTFQNVHLIFLAQNELKNKLSSKAPCTLVGGVQELGNFLLSQQAKKVCFYNSATIYRLLSRVKKLNNIEITEIVHSYHRWNDSMHNATRNLVDKTLVVSATVAKQWGITQFDILPPTIDEKRFQIPKIAHEGVVVGTVARFSPEKNLKRIVDIAVEIGNGFKFVIVGKDGGSKQELITYAQQKRVAHKIFFKAHTDKIEEEYAGFDLFLLTSTIEGTPLTILEAQAANLPVIAPDVGSIKEMIKPKSGFVYPQETSNRDLATKIRTLVKKEGLKRSSERVNYNLKRKKIIGVDQKLTPLSPLTSRKKIFIPGNMSGGPKSFLDLFTKYAQEEFEIITEPTQDVDIVLAIAYQPRDYRWLQRQKLRGARIFHRLDGVPDPNSAAEASILKHVKNIAKLADCVIYQSTFCKEVWLDHISPNNSAVITNGKDIEIFNPFLRSSKSDDKIRLISISYSLFRSKNLNKIIEIAQSLPDDFEMTLIGNYLSMDQWRRIRFDPSKAARISQQNIGIHRNLSYYPLMNNSDLASYLREADFLIFPAENDACSNTVIESLCCGTPVVYNSNNYGGTRELVGERGFSFDYNHQPLAKLLDLLRARKNNYIEATATSYLDYDYQKIYNRYMEIFRFGEIDE